MTTPHSACLHGFGGGSYLRVRSDPRLAPSKPRLRTAGTPIYRPFGSQSLTTTAPAATTQPWPIVTPGSTVTDEQIQDPAPMRMGLPQLSPARLWDVLMSCPDVTSRTWSAI